jgi:hypothetical protein
MTEKIERMWDTLTKNLRKVRVIFSKKMLTCAPRAHANDAKIEIFF